MKHYFVEWKSASGAPNSTRLYKGKKIAMARAHEISRMYGNAVLGETDGFGHVTRTDVYALN